MVASWEKTYARLVRQHANDQRQIERLHRQLNRFRSQHARLQKQLAQEAQNCNLKMQMLDSIRQELRKYEQREHTLTKAKREALHKLKEYLPSDSLNQRVKLMEVTEHVPIVRKQRPQVKPGELSLPTFKRSLRRLSVGTAQVKTQSAVERRLAKIRDDEQVLKRIQGKTLKAIYDIQQLKGTIQYLKRSQCSKLRIKPYVERLNWLEMTTKERQKDVKATIVMDCLEKKKSKKHITREKLEVRPSFILKNIPELMPQMYHYLEKDKQ